MNLKYGKDYGIKVYSPWHIKCPIINRLFNTCLIHISLTTFTKDGTPLIGVNGTFRVPYVANDYNISSLLDIRYAFPSKNRFGDVGYGLLVCIELLDVNHRKVLDARPEKSGTCLSVETMAYDRETKLFSSVWYGSGATYDVNFAKKDFKAADER